jgi:hypothetical protein
MLVYHLVSVLVPQYFAALHHDFHVSLDHHVALAADRTQTHLQCLPLAFIILLRV